MTPSSFEAGEIIVKQGDQGDHLFVIIAGAAVVEMDGQTQPAELRAGSIFGELALLYNCTRTASVIGE
jgi:CRP-like cAMP-binding protein